MSAMTCPQPADLSRAIASGIDPELRAHLRECDACADEVEAHAAIVNAARDLPIVEPTREQAYELRSALQAAAQVRPPMVSFRAMWATSAAVVLCAAAVLLVFGLRGTKGPDAVAMQYRGSVHAHDGARYIRVGGPPDEIVRLMDGTLTVEVEKLLPGERFRVVTDDGEVEVRGTAFDVSARDDKLRAVRVLHGRVEVRSDHASAPVMLDVDQRWDVTKLASVDPTIAAPPGPSVEDSGLEIVATQATAATATAPSATTTVPAPARPSITTDVAKPTATAPTATTAPPPAKATVPTTSAPARSSITTDVAKTSTPVRPSITTDVAKPTTPAKPTTTKLDPLSPRAPGPRAPTTPSLTTGTPPAKTVNKRPIELLFDEGWSALASGDPRRAATAFEKAARTAPDDPLAEDAWFWRASALSQARASGASEALATFLKQYTRSPRAGEASAMLGWLLLERGDLDAAEARFRAAANDRVDRVRGSAAKGLAAVEQRRAP